MLMGLNFIYLLQHFFPHRLNKEDDAVFKVLLDIVGLIQLNTIHIGHNKHFTFLIKNKASTFIEGAIYANYTEQILITEKPTQFIISLEHKLSPDGPVLNSFQFKFKNNGIEEDGKTRTQISFDRKKELENVSKFFFIIDQQKS